MYNRLHTIRACDGRTDGRTDTVAVGFVRLIFPPVWSRALTQALVTGPFKSLDPDSGTACSAGFTASVRHDSRPVQETAEDSFVWLRLRRIGDCCFYCAVYKYFYYYYY